MKESILLRVKVSAGAKRESCTEVALNTFVVRVKEKAERNLANRRVIELLALRLHLTPKNFRIVSGMHAHAKLIRIIH